MRKTARMLAGVGLWACLGSCQPDSSFGPPEEDCSGFGLPQISLGELKGYYRGQTVQIRDSLQWEGTVVSSDASSNLYGEVYLQDRPRDPEGGIVLLVDLSESHVRIPYGARVSLSLKGLYLGNSGGAYTLGGAFPSFGNLGVGRLPAPLVPAHLRVLCSGEASPEPTPVALPELTEAHLHTFVELQGVEVTGEDVGLPFAVAGEETRRTLQDCEGNTIALRSSGYSDFYADLLPPGHGRVRGLLGTYRNRYELSVMDPGALSFEDPRCEDRIVKKTSDQILISEIADPDNLPQARFLELYNASDTALALHGWELRRFTNANPEPGAAVSLGDLQIGPGAAVVLSAYPDVFEATYGFPPDLQVPVNGPADSNGDDSMELVDPFGNVVDVFGVPGTDGSGTAHEFEDGRALRKAEVSVASPVFDPSQWIIANDSGGNGTLNQPCNAPGDFTPGSH